MTYKVAIITLSDNGSQGLRQDLSGPKIKDIMTSQGFEVVSTHILSDDPLQLKELLIDICDNKKAQLILTTGGTGFSKRDNTPEATLEVIERNVPGIAEAMRMKSLSITPRAMLSRGVSGIRKDTLIINLPGSPKAAEENLQVILPVLTHGLNILSGNEVECAVRK
ncbi:MAG: MogA/MoaB family molybdenum cofactor biosynthesis protein [Lachnospiraceae bacterium]|nr:MogA/MoaB family molybdenum cofactor biosynthesis protein [Lachnospiraceae bacterium]